MSSETPPRSASERVYRDIRDRILRGAFPPAAPLRPQELADAAGVSLAAAREALLRLVGEGFAERMPNRGFAVQRADARRWQEIAQARALIEPAMLRIAIDVGDVAWEADVRAAHHTLLRTAFLDPETGEIADAWNDAHHRFHAALLAACDNEYLIETFQRLWTAGSLARQWSAAIHPDRDVMSEHAALEAAALDRRADDAARILSDHITGTVAALRGPTKTSSHNQKGA